MTRFLYCWLHAPHELYRFCREEQHDLTLVALALAVVAVPAFPLFWLLVMGDWEREEMFLYLRFLRQ